MTVHRADFRFTHRLRVRWAEVDMQKIVFNAHYLMYFDTAVADYWRVLGLPYDDTMQALGGDLYVKKATVEFHASARCDDRIDVCLTCSRIGTSSMRFDGAIFRDNVLLVTCELVYVFAHPSTQTSQPVPDVLRAALLGFEAGEPMLSLRTGAWAELEQAASPLRRVVFLAEQGIPASLEWDTDDATALHAVALNRLGVTVATGRLLACAGDPATTPARIGRMAVHRMLRGSGVGQRVLETLSEQARDRGHQQVLLHAQTSAQGFYARCGYRTVGECFVEAGIEHIEMMRAL
jgi:YbgC/YbaW family acyl-CoA thioester hydrolase